MRDGFGKPAVLQSVAARYARTHNVLEISVQRRCARAVFRANLIDETRKGTRWDALYELGSRGSVVPERLPIRSRLFAF